MVEDGYILADQVPYVPDFPIDKVDFGWVIYWKNQLFEVAHNWFIVDGGQEQKVKFNQFCQSRDWWLDDYALFIALKQKHVG